MTSAGPTPENEGIDPELQAAVESAFEEVPDDVRDELVQGSPEGAAGQSDAASDEEAAGEDPLAQAQAQAAGDASGATGSASSAGAASSNDEDIVDAEIVDDEDSK